MFAVNDIRAKVAYLQGLAEGLDLDTGSPEGRVLSSMLEVMVDMADQVGDITEAQASLAEYVEDVDFDLGALEESMYGDDDDDDDETIAFLPTEALTEEEDGVQISVCPECGEALAAGAGDLEGDFDVVCPTCGCMVCNIENADHHLYTD